MSGGRRAEEEAKWDGVCAAALAGEGCTAAMVVLQLLAPVSGFAGCCHLLWKRARVCTWPIALVISSM